MPLSDEFIAELLAPKRKEKKEFISSVHPNPENILGKSVAYYKELGLDRYDAYFENRVLGFRLHIEVGATSFAEADKLANSKLMDEDYELVTLTRQWMFRDGQ